MVQTGYKLAALSMAVGLFAACSTAAPVSLVSSSSQTQTPVLTDFSPTGAVSDAARATRPERPPEYENVRAMLENADMSAFMQESRGFYETGSRSASWGFAAIDMIAAGEAATALTLVNEMPRLGSSGEVLSADWLRPWALASTGEADEALEAIEVIWLKTPVHLYRGHRALLLEGMGRIDEAIEAYDASEELDRPGDDEEPSMENVVRALSFGAERILSLRKANLLHRQGRNEEAKSVYDELLAADPSDAYSQMRLDDLASGEEPEGSYLTLAEALAMALNDEAGALEERQMLASVLLAKGSEAPFNHFISALRQSALVLDPDNASVREIEAEHLYDHGFFEASARLALSGDLADDPDADLQMAAAEAYLELGREQDARALVTSALEASDSAYTKLHAVELFIRSDSANIAIDMIRDVLSDDELDENLSVYAHMLEAEARQHDGDIDGAIVSARRAFAIDDQDDNARAFLASMLTLSSDVRDEGLNIYRDLIASAPNDTGMMNNYGYSLVKEPQSSDELDEGFRLLKRANRQTPFEPNLLDSLGWAYYQYGEYNRAEKLIKKAIEGYAPFSHWELFDHLGDVQWRLGKTDEARKTWLAAIDARPPKLDRSRITLKLEEGLTTPAPEKRTPPLVPTDKPVETNEI